MKTVILLISLLYLGISCDHKSIECLRPSTEKEQTFISEYRKKGLEVSLERFNYPYSGDSVGACARYMTDAYTISIANESIEKIKNIDSMRSKSKEIACLFYEKIISDSIIAYSTEFVIQISSKIKKEEYQSGNSELIAIESSSFYLAKFRKEDLEDFCKFQVVESGNKLIRKPINKTSNDLFIFSEFTSK